MSRVRTALAWAGTFLLPMLSAGAEAQYPISRERTTSTVGTRFGDTTVATPAPAPATGRTRQLVCRGVEGLKLDTVASPSPRNSREVAMSLAYRRNPRAAGSGYEQLDPGACSWTVTADPSLPAEPGKVQFDISPQGSELVPDPVTLGRWLNDPRHYWVFYVDDLSNVAISHGPYGTMFRAQPTDAKPAPSRPAAERRERLRCRGGGGASFVRGARKGPNLFAMTLTYQAAPTAAGPIGKGLEPGTCAWADRADAPAEPGKIEFLTARNAQREQQQTGAPVDSSATAAERYPDVQTIPAYMTSPAHYWTFTVSLTNPDSAIRHAAWLPTATDAPPPTPGPVATTPSTPSGGAGDSPYTSTSPTGARTTVSFPIDDSGVADPYTPGAGNTTVTDPRRVYDIRSVQVRTGLEGATITFEAAPNLAPVLSVSTSAPEGAEGGARFSGASTRMVVQGTPTGGTHWRYSAASTTPLARATRYWFLAEAPEGPNSRYNQVTGEFRTLAQKVTITVSEIYVISDSDSDSDGDLVFFAMSCPRAFTGNLPGDYTAPLQWSEGRHAVNATIASNEATDPDRFRLLIVGVDNDSDIGDSGSSSTPYITCRNGGQFEPEATSRGEWNAVVMDLDMSRYPGAKGGEPFVRRSLPLRNGSKLAFEVRGYIEVTRQ